jgi:hypothetical protein
MIFIESPVFTEDVKRLLTDASYADLQLQLAQYPFTGDLIKGTSGLRKVRWPSGGKGKSGGVRVIGIKDDLTPKEKRILRKLNEEWH